MTPSWARLWVRVCEQGRGTHSPRSDPCSRRVTKVSQRLCRQEEEGGTKGRRLLLLCLMETRCEPPQLKDSFREFLSSLPFNQQREAQPGLPSSCWLGASRSGMGLRTQKVMTNSSSGAAPRAETTEQPFLQLPAQTHPPCSTGTRSGICAIPATATSFPHGRAVLAGAGSAWQPEPVLSCV